MTRQKTSYRTPELVLSLALTLAVFLAWPARAEKEAAEPKLVKTFEGIRFGILGYLDYSAGALPLPGDQEQNYNRFALTRGYLTVSNDLQPWLGMRLTTDLSQESKDTQESLSGSYVVRMKYLYGELRPHDLGLFTQLKAEVGMGHMPWLDFEESINPYRCQGTMAMERAGVFNSADLGVSLLGNLGGRLPEAGNKTGNKKYDGRFGSWHLGVFNGGGYTEVEKNQNKVVEGRLTFRPLPTVVPGLQVSYLGIYGEGNQEIGNLVNGTTLDEIPAYSANLGMLSYERPELILTGQYFATQGNAKGAWVDTQSRALDTEGYSGFGKLTLPGMNQRLSLFGRWDYFNVDAKHQFEDADQAGYTMWLTGLAFNLYQGNLLLASYETTDYQQDSGGKGNLPVADNRLGEDNRWQVVYQFKF